MRLECHPSVAVAYLGAYFEEFSGTESRVQLFIIPAILRQSCRLERSVQCASSFAGTIAERRQPGTAR